MDPLIQTERGVEPNCSDHATTPPCTEEQEAIVAALQAADRAHAETCNTEGFTKTFSIDDASWAPSEQQPSSYWYGQVPPPVWPTQLLSIELLQCVKIENLFALSQSAWPSQLQTLIINNCRDLQILSTLPLTLETLEFSACFQLHTILELPATLQKITMRSCPSIRALPAFSDRLQELHLSHCDILESLAPFHSTLEKLHISNCSRLQEPPIWAEGLEELHISHCFRLGSLSVLPSTLKRLHVSFCNGLKTLPKFPEGLKELHVSGAWDLTTLGVLPSTLKKLHVSFCSQLESISELPHGLEELSVNGCSHLEPITALPTTLKQLHISSCGHWARIPLLSEGLEELDLSCCFDLTDLSAWPSTLKKVDLRHCTHLLSIPSWPPQLEELDLRECALQYIPILPHSLKQLDLSTLPDPMMTPALLKQCQELEKLHCVIHYSEAWTSIHQVPFFLERLDALIQASELRTPSLRKIFERFITEVVGRGGAPAEQIAALLPLMQGFENDLQHLAWAETIASSYLEGCINQPVQGCSMIAAWMSIAQADTLHAKLNAARHLLTLDAVQSVVTQSKGENVGPEGANALLRTIYSELRASGHRTHTWFCVPNLIAYEDIATLWLHHAPVLIAKMQIKQMILTLPVTDIALRLCDTEHSLLWGEITMPKELLGLKQYYHSMKEDWLALNDGSDESTHSARAALLQTAPSTERLQLFDRAHTILKDKPESTRLQYYRDLEITEDRALRQTITTLTHKALFSTPTVPPVLFSQQRANSLAAAEPDAEWSSRLHP